MVVIIMRQKFENNNFSRGPEKRKTVVLAVKVIAISHLFVMLLLCAFAGNELIKR